MIEAKDLRIGNWVYLSSHKKDIGEVHLGFNNTNLDLFEPIELTEEWVIKFGYEDLIDMAISFCKQSEYYGVEITSEDLRKIKVHEAQNLYYALTGGELTIK
jgi:hypothetical protein